jgi:penicillin-binding protein 2
MGISKIAEHARALGLGEDRNDAGRRSGVMPSPGGSSRHEGPKWYAGETISVSIGQVPPV